MTTFRLIYFNVRGRVDPLRMLCELAGQPYEFEPPDLRSWRTDGKERVKAFTPFGQLPVLQHGDRYLSQSLAISRYLARHFSLYGADTWENARCDEVVETAQECIIEVGKLYWDPAFNTVRESSFTKEKERLDSFNTFFLRMRNSPLHWVGDKVSIADVYAAYYLELLPILYPTLFTQENYKDLFAFYHHFFNLKSIAGYVRSDRRPKAYTVSMASFGGKPEDCVQWT